MKIQSNNVDRCTENYRVFFLNCYTFLIWIHIECQGLVAVVELVFLVLVLRVFVLLQHPNTGKISILLVCATGTEL